MFIYLYEYHTGQYGNGSRSLEFLNAVLESGETVKFNDNNIIECESFRGSYRGSWIQCSNTNKELSKEKFISMVKELVEKYKTIIIISSTCGCPLPRGHYYISCNNRAFIISKEPIKELTVEISGVLCRHCLDPGEYKELIDISKELIQVKRVYLIQCTART